MWRFFSITLLVSALFAPERALSREIDEAPAEERFSLEAPDIEFDDEGEIAPKAPRPPRIGFTRYRVELGRMCILLSKDGRQEYFYKLLLDNVAPDEDCIACEKFFRTFAAACKPKVAKVSAEKKAEEEPVVEPKAVLKQRDPHPELILKASQVFTKIAEDKHHEEIAKAIAVLANLLKTDSIQTPAERDYFTVVAATMSAPFAEAEKHANDSAKNPNLQIPPPDVNNLFE